MPGAEFVLSFNPNSSNPENPDFQFYHLASANESFSVGIIQVHTIPALSDGIGYIIDIDGVKIFDARLHVSDNNSSNILEYRKEIDLLKPFGPIDIEIMSVQVHGIHVRVDYESYLYLFDQLSPRTVYLVDANLPELYKKSIEVLKVRNIPIEYPEGGIAVGQRFHFVPSSKQK